MKKKINKEISGWASLYQNFNKIYHTNVLIEKKMFPILF